MKKKNIVPSKKERPKSKPMSIQSLDGFNLAEFSLSPLTFKTKNLAHKKLSFEWTQNLGAVENANCYFRLSYGEVPPNASTEDYLLVLLYLAQKKGDPLSLETSFFEIMKTKGATYRPNKKDTESILRHLDALMDIKIETNYLYDREKNSWNRGIKTRVISSYTYKNKQQQRTRQITRDGERIQSLEEVHELERITFVPEFYNYFVKDNISFDLATYFSLEKPTAKRIYRFGNKNIQQFGQFEIDFVHFCVTRIGMLQSYVDSFTYVSKLVSKVRPHVNRVNETIDNFRVEIVKDKTKPSGYKVIFEKVKNVGTSKATETQNSFTTTEKKVYELLLKNGLYASVARNLVLKFRTHFGRKAIDYVGFVLKEFKNFEKKGLQVKLEKRGGVLQKAFEDEWYFPHFMEWSSKKEAKEAKEEAKRYGDPSGLNLFSMGLKMPLNEVSKQNIKSENVKKQILKPIRFSFQRFKQDYPEVYQRILVSQTQATEKMKASLGEAWKLILTSNGKHSVEQGILNRVEVYCKNCFTEFQKNNLNYYPPNLLEK